MSNIQTFAIIDSNHTVYERSLDVIPVFSSGLVYDYSITFPFIISNVSFLPTYGVNNSVYLDHTVDDGSGQLVRSGDMLAPAFFLALGVNHYRIVSSQDGFVAHHQSATGFRLNA